MLVLENLKERQQHQHSGAILLHGQANGQEERQDEKEELSLVEVRAEDTVTLAELETQSRGVSR